MPRIAVVIEWDVPHDPNWLNPCNLELVLGEYCPNTLFTVAQIGDGKTGLDMALQAGKGIATASLSYRLLKVLIDAGVDGELFQELIAAIQNE